MAVTLKEVAEKAGVSPATVSRVIHNNSRISPETGRLVRQAMKELGYVPNAAARSLAGKSPKTLGLVLPNNPDELFRNPFFISVMRGISVYAQEQGYFHMYAFSRDEEEEVDFLNRYVNSGWVSGIVLLTARENDRCVSYLKETDFPFVMIGRPDDAAGTLWVDNDNFQAMYGLTGRLLDESCRNIAFLGGPSSLKVTRDRFDGYVRALESRGILLKDELIHMAEDFSEEKGREAAKLFLNGHSKKYRPDAIAATDDQLAFGVLDIMKERGVTDLRVTGFNNTPRSLYNDPGLTTVDVNPDLLGEKAAELIISRLEKRENSADHYIVDTSLIVRQSG